MSATTILLSTLNARYHHASFGLRYLMANLKELQSETKLVEFTIAKNPRDIVEEILGYRPKILGLGVYIWNTKQISEVISLLKRVAPEILVVLGGPEVSHETESQALYHLADFIIKGEADFLFYEFCKNYLSSGELPREKTVSGPLPDILRIASPYSYYTDEDIKNRVIYVEASRGCPYTCEFCLSSLDRAVRQFELDSFLADMGRLIERGVRQFKFVDRTFNLNLNVSRRILQFFLDRIHQQLFLHFEMVPDRLPQDLKELIQQFPPGSLQFEIGIQSWDKQVSANVGRRQDYGKIVENFRFLIGQTHVHIHADLIVGLPGETLESFARGFDAVSELEPHEIQVGILKRLKGTPITRQDSRWGMVYEEHPPFQVVKTKALSFEHLQKMGRLAHFWDLLSNSGNFKSTMKLLKEISATRENPSWFWEFFRLSEFLSFRHPQGHGISLLNLVHSVWIYLTEHLHLDADQVRSGLILDYTGTVKRDVPPFLRRDLSPQSERIQKKILKVSSVPSRQLRHLHQSLS